jgi:hypothetical protein
LRYINALRAFIGHFVRTAPYCSEPPRKDPTMPLQNIIILVAIVAAFATCGLAWAWGEYQTRLALRERARTVTPPVSQPKTPDDMKLAA